MPKHGSLALSCADKPGWSFFEGLLVLPQTEHISLAFVDGGNRGVAVHSAHRAETFVGGETARFGVDHIRVRVRPAASLVFDVVGRFLGYVAAEIALNHTESKIHAGGKSARGRQIAIFHESGSASQTDVGEVHGEVFICRVKRGR